MHFLRFTLGLFLLPLLVALAWTLADLVAPVGWFEREPAWLVGGFLGWCLVWLILPKPVLLYVLGHELTHAIWAHVMGAEVRNLRVARSGGSVTVSKSNIWIALAPYFFPIYTVLVIVLALIAGLLWDISPWAHPLLAAIGATWGFHFTFTIQMLLLGQSDLRPYGTFFSLVVILGMNILGLSAGVIATGTATLEHSLKTLRSHTQTSYLWTTTQVQDAGKMILKKF